MKMIKKLRELLEVQTYPELEAAAQRQRRNQQSSMVVVAAAGLLK